MLQWQMKIDMVLPKKTSFIVLYIRKFCIFLTVKTLIPNQACYPSISHLVFWRHEKLIPRNPMPKFTGKKKTLITGTQK